MKYIGLIILALLLLIGQKISSFFINNLKHIIISFFILSVIIPIMISIKTSWQIPEFMVAYIFIIILIGFTYLTNKIDNKNYKKTHRYNYYISSKNSEQSQKRRNGGITDEELKLRKKIIKNNLKI
jgi:energy-coupling factor transporter transmembrane protein EcfT